MDQTLRASIHPRATWTTDDIRSAIEKSKVVVFAKGTSEQPRCGFTERVLDAIAQSGKPFDVVDVCEDRSIVPALRAFSGEHHLPLVYVNGELVSSSDTQAQVLLNGELEAKVKAALGDRIKE